LDPGGGGKRYAKDLKKRRILNLEKGWKAEAGSPKRRMGFKNNTGLRPAR